VIWYPPRSAAEHIPAGMHAVTITASTFLPRPGTITRTFTSPAVVARLAAMLNGAHASDLGLVPCPLAVGSYRLAFATSPRAAPYLVATDPGCPGIAVSVAGRAQPPLQVPAALQTTLAALMHVHGLPGPGYRQNRARPGRMPSVGLTVKSERTQPRDSILIRAAIGPGNTRVYPLQFVMLITDNVHSAARYA